MMLRSRLAQDENSSDGKPVSPDPAKPDSIEDQPEPVSVEPPAKPLAPPVDETPAKVDLDEESSELKTGKDDPTTVGLAGANPGAEEAITEPVKPPETTPPITPLGVPKANLEALATTSAIITSAEPRRRQTNIRMESPK